MAVYLALPLARKRAPIDWYGMASRQALVLRAAVYERFVRRQETSVSSANGGSGIEALDVVLLVRMIFIYFGPIWIGYATCMITSAMLYLFSGDGAVTLIGSPLFSLSVAKATALHLVWTWSLSATVCLLLEVYILSTTESARWSAPFVQRRYLDLVSPLGVLPPWMFSDYITPGESRQGAAEGEFPTPADITTWFQGAATAIFEVIILGMGGVAMAAIADMG